MAGQTEAKRKLVLKMSVSLDGFVAGPNGEADWIFRTSGGADSTGWVLDTLRGAGVHIMGSRSYYDMAAFWPYSEMPIAPPGPLSAEAETCASPNDPAAVAVAAMPPAPDPMAPTVTGAPLCSVKTGLGDAKKESVELPATDESPQTAGADAKKKLQPSA